MLVCSLLAAEPSVVPKPLEVEAFNGLKAVYVSEKSFFAEKDRYSTNLSQLGFEPDSWCEDGARLRIKEKPSDYRKIGCHFFYEVETIGEGPAMQVRIYARGAVPPVVGVNYLVETGGTMAGIPRRNPR